VQVYQIVLFLTGFFTNDLKPFIKALIVLFGEGNKTGCTIE